MNQRQLYTFFNEHVSLGQKPALEGNEEYRHFHQLLFEQSWPKSYLHQTALSDLYLLGPSQIFQKIDNKIVQNSQSPFCDLDEDWWELFLRSFALSLGVDWSPLANPLVSISREWGDLPCRFSFSHKAQLETSHSTLIMRIHSKRPIPLSEFTRDIAAAGLVEQKVARGDNLLICGPAGSGKTSLMRSLSELIPSHEHIVSIEDTAELHFDRPFCSSLIAERSELTELVYHALRISPDRLLVGELRGPEIAALCLAMNTGHKGLMTTLHADNAASALERLDSLFGHYTKNETRPQWNRYFPFVVFMKDRAIQQIIEVKGIEKHGSPIIHTLYSSKN